MKTVLKLLGLNNLTSETIEAMIPLMIIAACILVIVIILLVDASENSRIRRWVDRNAGLEIPMTRWRTIIPWHREGSRWFIKRCGDSKIRYGTRSIRKTATANQDDTLYKNINRTTRVNIRRGRYMTKR